VNLFKPVGQFAIAASAAGLMIVGVQQNVAQNDPQYDRITPSQVVQTVPFGGVADPVSFNYQQPNRNAQRQAYLEQQRRFQALLSDHQRQIKLISAAKTVKSKSTIQQKVADTPK